MGRIRYIKPGFFTNETLAELTPWARLLFIGLWTLADKHGRLEDRPKRIKAQLFPWDRIDLDKCLSELDAAGLIVRYEADGVRCIDIPKWNLHQRPHPKEADAGLPIPPERSMKTQCREITRQGDEKKFNSTLQQAGNGDGDESGNEKGDGERAPRPAPPAPEKLRDVWNDLCGTLPKCLELGDERQRRAHQRLNDRSLEQWAQIVDRIAASRFCCGDNDRGWVATFDWLLRPETATKVVEGKYDNRAKSGPRPAKKLGPNDPGYYDEAEAS